MTTSMLLRHTGWEDLGWRTVSDQQCTKTQRTHTIAVYQPNPAAMNTLLSPVSMTTREREWSRSRCIAMSWVLTSPAVMSIFIPRRTSISPKSKPPSLKTRAQRFWWNMTISHLTRPLDLRWKSWSLPSRPRITSVGRHQRILGVKSSIHKWGPQWTGSVTSPRSMPLRHRTSLIQTLTGKTRPWLALVVLCDVS